MGGDKASVNVDMCFYTFHRFNMENQIGGTATATLGNEMKLNKTGLQACCLWMNQPWKPVDSPKLQRHIITVEVTKLFGLPTFSYSPLMFSVFASTCSCLVMLSLLHGHLYTHTHTHTHKTHFLKQRRMRTPQRKTPSPESRPCWWEGPYL